jgi:Rieske Fe-S protein
VGQAVLANLDDNTAVIVARDGRGFHALSAICTHACCLVSLCRVSTCSTVTSNPGECAATDSVSVDENASTIACPCHGSSFRLIDGAPTGGPARRPLPSYALRFDAQDALVDTARTVDAAARV